MFKKFIIISLLITSFQFSQANEKLEIERKVEAILDNSGIQKQTLQLKETMVATLKDGISMNKKLSAEQAEKLYQISIEEFRPATILTALKKKLINEWSQKDIDKLYEYYEQGDVKKFSRLEEDGSSIASQPAMIEYAKSLEKNPPEKERITVITNFMRDAKVVESGVRTYINIFEGVSLGIGKKITESDLTKLKNNLTPVMTQGILLACLFIYKDIPLDELKNYLTKHTTNRNLQKLSDDFLIEQGKGFQQWGFSIGLRAKKEVPRYEECKE